MSRVAIIGSRDASPALLDLVRDYIKSLPPGTVIVTGAWWANRSESWLKSASASATATRGVDLTAAIHADDCNFTVVLVAGPRSAGKLAGARRNPTIIDIADRVVAFWDGSSRGTKQGIDYCRANDKQLLIIREP